MIAMALACEPALLVADEPTTALDVTVQAGILDLIVELTHERGMGLIMISHDLGVITRTTERTAVMYAGRFVETGKTLHFLESMAHPYSQGLYMGDAAACGAIRSAGMQATASANHRRHGSRPAAADQGLCIFQPLPPCRA